MQISVILLAGGVGSRMRATTPKQFMPLMGKTIAEHSFDLFLSLPQISEITIVADPSWHYIFKRHPNETSIKFAAPGKERSDSVYNGLQNISKKASLVLIHDAARPLINAQLITELIQIANKHGAALLGRAVAYTIKKSSCDGFVSETVDRASLFEAQTPQAVKPELLKEGFRVAKEKNIAVTDDVSLVELLGHPVKLVEGPSSNIKITTQEDLILAKSFMETINA
jgi:2-C-methyl-D-erythritol 4-phosphate cytidylyltransferase